MQSLAGKAPLAVYAVTAGEVTSARYGAGPRSLREGTGALGICCIAGLITRFAYQWRMTIPR
jgi:hypothetical protein